MPGLNVAAIVVAGVATFAFAAAYYSALARQRAEVSPFAAEMTQPPAWLMGLELAKALFVAAAVSLLVALLGITDLVGALALAVGLWLTFPVVLLIGSVTEEGVPVRLAAIHAGDWLAKLVIIAVVATVWRQGGPG
jgi:hypothetical protein